jgi:hypothetical protein
VETSFEDASSENFTMVANSCYFSKLTMAIDVETIQAARTEDNHATSGDQEAPASSDCTLEDNLEDTLEVASSHFLAAEQNLMENLVFGYFGSVKNSIVADSTTYLEIVDAEASGPMEEALAYGTKVAFSLDIHKEADDSTSASLDLARSSCRVATSHCTDFAIM